MTKVLGLDLGTNSIGWAIADTGNNKIIDCGVKIFPEALPGNRSEQRAVYRQLIRRTQRLEESFYQPTFIDNVKRLFPVFIHSLLALLFAGSLLMAVTNQKDFQFWFNLAITVLHGWMAIKK